MHRRAFLTATAAAASAVTLKAAYAATVTPLGATGVMGRSTEPLPLGPLSGAVYPDPHIESLKKPKGAFGASGFPAFAGTMAVERVATGFRWAGVDADLVTKVREPVALPVDEPCDDEYEDDP